MTRNRHIIRLPLPALVLASLFLVFPVTDGLAAKKVNVNTASKKELAKVPGISKELAKLIVQYRREEGPIQSWDQVLLLMREAEIRKMEKHLTLDGSNNHSVREVDGDDDD